MVGINKNNCQTDWFGCLIIGNGARHVWGEEIWERYVDFYLNQFSYTRSAGG